MITVRGNLDGLHQLLKFNHFLTQLYLITNIAGEVVGYEYQANEDDVQENRESEELDSENDNKAVMVTLEKTRSAPLGFVSSQNHSSFHERYLGVTSIMEDDMEDTLRSASPNLELNNNNHKLLMWRTHKEISNDDYNEFSEHCNDFEQIEVYDQYISSMKRAISENNVLPIPRRESRYKRFFSSSKHNDEEEENSVSDSDSDAVDLKREITRFRSQNQDAIELDVNEIMSHTKNSYRNDVSSVSKEEEVSATGKNFSANKTNSCVDIDTIGGKVGLKSPYY